MKHITLIILGIMLMLIWVANANTCSPGGVWVINDKGDYIERCDLGCVKGACTMPSLSSANTITIGGPVKLVDKGIAVVDEVALKPELVAEKGLSLEKDGEELFNITFFLMNELGEETKSSDTEKSAEGARIVKTTVCDAFSCKISWNITNIPEGITDACARINTKETIKDTTSMWDEVEYPAAYVGEMYIDWYGGKDLRVEKKKDAYCYDIRGLKDVWIDPTIILNSASQLGVTYAREAAPTYNYGGYSTISTHADYSSSTEAAIIRINLSDYYLVANASNLTSATITFNISGNNLDAGETQNTSLILVNQTYWSNASCPTWIQGTKTASTAGDCEYKYALRPTSWQWYDPLKVILINDTTPVNTNITFDVTNFVSTILNLSQTNITLYILPLSVGSDGTSADSVVFYKGSISLDIGYGAETTTTTTTTTTTSTSTTTTIPGSSSFPPIIENCGVNQTVVPLNGSVKLSCNIYEPTNYTYYSYASDATSKDTYINSYDSSTNYNTYEELIVGNNVALSRKHRSILEFQIPAGVGEIGDVYLNIYCNGSEGYPQAVTRSITIHELNTSFNESSATWNKNDSSASWDMTWGSGVINTTALDNITISAGDECYDWQRFYLKGNSAVNNMSVTWNQTIRLALVSSSDIGSASYWVGEKFLGELAGENYSWKVVIESNISLNTSGLNTSGVYFTINNANVTPTNSSTEFFYICNRTSLVCNTTSSLINNNWTIAYGVDNSNNSKTELLDLSYITSTSTKLPNISFSPTTAMINLSGDGTDSIILNLTITEANADVNITWSNYTYTNLNVNQTYWSDWNGSAQVNFTFNKSALENKSKEFQVNIIVSPTGALPMINTTLTFYTRIKSYPHLLFNNITETPGYRYSSVSPWSGYSTQLTSWSGTYVAPAAMRYQMDGNTAAAAFAKNYLLTFTKVSGEGHSSGDGGPNRVYQLGQVVLTYDMVQPYLNVSENQIIRENIGELADQVYYDLNNGGTDSDYVSSMDYHIQAYCLMGVVGLALSDYENATLPHSSTSEQWLHAGTEDFFVNDTLHDYPVGRSMLSQQTDLNGRDSLNSYRQYHIDEMYLWAQVYSHVYNHSIMLDYPELGRWALTDLFYGLPNKYGTNYISGGNVIWLQSAGFINLFDATNQSYLWKFYQDTNSDNKLPYTREWTVLYGTGSDGRYGTMVAYATYENYTNLSFTSPTFTSIVNETFDTQVLRKDWSNMSSWIQLYTLNRGYRSNRNMMHYDQLHVDYYSKGDYILADSGETKYRVSGYGPISSKDHNSILVEDAGSMVGVSKGDDGFNLVTPAPLTASISNNAKFEFLEGTINATVKESSDGDDPFVTPFLWRRDVLYPNKDYMVILDYVNNSATRQINNVFQLTSYKHNATSSSSLIGVVYGNLSIGGTLIDWKTQTFNVEVNLTNSSSVIWNTTNIDNQALQTQIYSVPSSNTSINKYWNRMGGYDYSSEVDHPQLRFKINQSTPLYRITLVETSFVGNESLSLTTLTVTGQGSAIKAVNSTQSAYITHGNSTQVADIIKTDANISWSENKSGNWSGFLRGGTYLNASTSFSLLSNESINYALMNSSANKTTVLINADTPRNITVMINGTCNENTTVVKTGSGALAYGNGFGCPATNLVQFKATFASDSEYVITYGGISETTTTTTTTTTASTTTTTVAPTTTTTLAPATTTSTTTTTLTVIPTYNNSGMDATIPTIGIQTSSFFSLIALFFITATILVLGGMGYGSLGILLAVAEADFFFFVFGWLNVLTLSLLLLVNIIAVLSWMRRSR